MNVQKGSDTIWTFDDELARLPNVQIVPDPFWTFTLDSGRHLHAKGCLVLAHHTTSVRPFAHLLC